MIAIINRYSDPLITKECGDLAENIFKIALMREHFTLHGEHTNKFEVKKWTETEHNFDFIVGRDNIYYWRLRSPGSTQWG